jgi:hypothetical protein
MHISLLWSSETFCVTGYKHIAPPALMEFASSIFQRARFEITHAGSVRTQALPRREI